MALMRHRNGSNTPRVAGAQIARPLIYCANPLFRRSLASAARTNPGSEFDELVMGIACQRMGDYRASRWRISTISRCTRLVGLRNSVME